MQQPTITAATLYLPGQEPRVLSADETAAVEAFRYRLPDGDTHLNGNGLVIEHLLGAPWEVLASAADYAVYCVNNDDYTRTLAHNPAGEARLEELTQQLCEAFGPLLIIEAAA